MLGDHGDVEADSFGEDGVFNQFFWLPLLVATTICKLGHSGSFPRYPRVEKAGSGGIEESREGVGIHLRLR